MGSFDAFSSLAAAAVLAVAACKATNGSGPADASTQTVDSEIEDRADVGTSAMGDDDGQTRDVNASETTDVDAVDSGSDADATATNDSGYDGGPIACGTMTCASHEVCVFNQVVVGAYRPPNDAGDCPDGEVLIGVSCNAAPSYQCVAFPVACSAGGLSCGCAQSLCLSQPSQYTCMSVTGGVIGCWLDGP